MTHLKIEQNNGTIEEVSSTVIDKLYDIVSSGNLDQNSNLIGRLHTTATYQDYIDYLEDAFKVNGTKLLIIDATKKYLSFVDPVVASYWANSTYGDGTGIDTTGAASVLLIPAAAFKDNTSILSFDELGRYFPNCTTLYYDVFRGCTNLKSVDLSNITTFVNGALFYNCSALGSTNNGILNIPLLSNFGNGGGTFLGCTNLVEINIGSLVDNANKITYISGFNGCSNLLKITGLNMVQSVYESTFYNCANLESIDLTSNLTTLGKNAFYNCAKLKCIDLSNITTLSTINCFFGCTSLVDLSTNDPTLINNGAATYTFNWSIVPISVFSGCKLTNKSFIFPNATEIDAGAFQNSLITAISMPNVTAIYSSAFRYCAYLSTIGNSLSNITLIGEWAFLGCSNLSITDPDFRNVTSLGRCAFFGCSSLTGTLNLSGLTTFVNTTLELFRGCSGLSKIIIGHIDYIQVTKWGDGRSTFAECSSLKVVDVNQLDYLILSNHTLINNNVFEAFIIRNTTTIPTILTDTAQQALFTSLTSSSNAKIYVDDNLYSTYINHTDWSDLASHIDVISNYNPS